MNKKNNANILLVSMPFDSLDKPLLGIGVLVSAAKNKNLNIQAIHTKFNFAEKIGHDVYKFLCIHTEKDKLTGEYIFSQAAFGIQNKEAYMSKIDKSWKDNANMLLRRLGIDMSFESLLDKTISIAGTFVAETVKKILATGPKIVACSSMFEQNCASLALLKEIKRCDPSIVTIMGGSNCEGKLGVGIIESFDWVDYVVSGEGDRVFPQLCSQIIHHNLECGGVLPQGVITKSNVNMLKEDQLLASVSVDEIHCPNYDDYFSALDQYQYKDQVKPEILVESSRGCWWGERESRRCRFCGLNGMNANYRGKDAVTVLDEMVYLNKRYKVDKFFFADNTIGMHRFDDLLPDLAKASQGAFQLHCEIKANLREHHIRRLKEAGAVWVQPGIENLHDDALKALGKGTRGIINIQLLKFARMHDINIMWNYLTNIPGENDLWYKEVMDWIDTVSHLQAPSGIAPLRIDRFSLYEKEPEVYNIKLEMNPAYRIVYPEKQHNIQNLCRFYENANDNGIKSKAIMNLNHALYEWQSQYYSSERPRLVLYEKDKKDKIFYIRDTRPCAVETKIILENELYLTYHVCFQVIHIHRISQAIYEKFGVKLSQECINKCITKLQKMKILMKSKQSVLALAVPVSYLVGMLIDKRLEGGLKI